MSDAWGAWPRVCMNLQTRLSLNESGQVVNEVARALLSACCACSSVRDGDAWCMRQGRTCFMQLHCCYCCSWWCLDCAGCGSASTSSSQANPVLRKTTLSRLQSAGQQLLLSGRAT